MATATQVPRRNLAILVLLATVLSLGAAECLVRVAALADARIRSLAVPVAHSSRTPVTVSEFIESRADALVPHGNYLGYHRNRFGFNDREPEDEGGTESFRILGLGDSFTFGVAPYPRAYLTIAEASATLFTYGAPPVVIHNLGVPASGLADYRRVFHLFGRELNADLALVTVYLGNDFLDSQGWKAQTRRSDSGPRSWLLTFVSRVWRIRSDSDWETVHTSPEAGVRGGDRGGRQADLSDEGDDFGRRRTSDEAWSRIVDAELQTFILGPDEEHRAELFFAELERLQGDLDAAGVPMALVMAPTRLQVESEDLSLGLTRALLDATQIDLDRPAERILSWAAARNVPVLDLTPFFEARAGEPPGLYIPNDTHWNIAGNGLAGLEVGRWLVQSGLPSPRNPDSDD